MRRMTLRERLLVMAGMSLASLAYVATAILELHVESYATFRESQGYPLCVAGTAEVWIIFLWDLIGGKVPSIRQRNRRFILKRSEPIPGLDTGFDAFEERRGRRGRRPLSHLCSKGVARLAGIPRQDLPDTLLVETTIVHPGRNTMWKEVLINGLGHLGVGPETVGLSITQESIMRDMFGDKPFWVRFETKETIR